MVDNLACLKVNENELKNEFDSFLNKAIVKWAEKTYNKILSELNSLEDLEFSTKMHKIKIENYEAFNTSLGKKLLFAELELRDSATNMYWNGKLKLSFNAKVSYYTKNSNPFKKYYMKVALPYAVKKFTLSLEELIENDEITVVLDGCLYDGNGNRTTVYFDNLNEEYFFESDSDYVLRFISLNLTYVKSK